MYSMQVIPIPRRRMRRVQEAAAVAPTRCAAGAPEVVAPRVGTPDAPAATPIPLLPPKEHPMLNVRIPVEEHPMLNMLNPV